MKRCVIVSSILVVAALCAPFIIGSCVRGLVPDRDQYFDALHHDLDTGAFPRELIPSSPELDPLVRYYKPAAAVKKVAPDGVPHHVMIYEKRNLVIHLYYKDNLAYAACISGFYFGSVHRWFFLDERLLAEYAAIPEGM